MHDGEIFLDVETTGLNEPGAVDDSWQPHIIEIAALRHKQEGPTMFHSFVKPPISITEEMEKNAGGITNEMVKDAPTFARLFPDFAEFCLGGRLWVAHNIEYDLTCIKREIERLDLITSFPWPLGFFCTYQEALTIPESRRPPRSTLGALYEHITGDKLKGAHRADVDTRAVAVIYDWILDERS